MKAVLVIDEMPENCLRCHYCGFREEDENKKVCMFMSHAYVLTGNLRERNAFCPLNPLPEPITEYDVKVSFDYDEEYAFGWNACLAEILGDYITQEEADLCGVQLWHDD